MHLPLRSTLLALSLGLVACGSEGPDFIECRDDVSCDRFPDGRCIVNPATGNQFCAYPDEDCPSGMQWSDLDVEPSISGMCVADSGDDAGIDASSDAGTDGGPDAAIDGGGTCVDRVLFSDDRSPNGEIWIANANGTGLVNLSNDPANESSPTVSPLGRVVFRRGGTPDDLFAVDLDGDNLVNLTNTAATESSPVLSPDGTSLAFQRNGALYVANADASDAQAVATGTIYYVAWNPTGTSLAFELSSAGNSDVWVVNASGAGLTQLTADAAYDGQPMWSPDGTKIAFTSQRDAQSDIWVMDADDGGNLVNLTNDAATNGGPSWSPDGTRIAFSKTGDIYTIAATGGTQTPLSTTPDGEYFPKWSPDGTKVLFRIDSGSYRDIGVVPASGGAVDIVQGPARYADSISWVPCD